MLKIVREAFGVDTGSTLTFDVGLTGVTDLNAYDVGLALTSSKGTAGTDFYFVGSPGTVAPPSDYVFGPALSVTPYGFAATADEILGTNTSLLSLSDFLESGGSVSDASPNTMLAAVVIRTTPEAGNLTLSFDGTPLQLLTPGGQAATGYSTLAANLASFNPPPATVAPEPTTLALLCGPLLAGADRRLQFLAAKAAWHFVPGPRTSRPFLALSPGSIGAAGGLISESRLIMAAENFPSRLEAISTRWTLLRAARDASAVSANEARNALVVRYLPAVRRYVAAVLSSDQDADDVAQDLAVRLLAGDFAGADPQRGRFRDLLKVAIRNMVRNRWNREKRRRGCALDIEQVAADEDDNDQCWTVEWRQSVLDLAWKALEQQQQAQPGSMAYTLLRLRTKIPGRLLGATGGPAFAGDRPGVPADAVRQKFAARVQFADLLLAEIANGLDAPTAEKIEDELAELGLIDLVRASCRTTASRKAVPSE